MKAHLIWYLNESYTAVIINSATRGRYFAQNIYVNSSISLFFFLSIISMQASPYLNIETCFQRFNAHLFSKFGTLCFSRCFAFHLEWKANFSTCRCMTKHLSYNLNGPRQTFIHIKPILFRVLQWIYKLSNELIYIKVSELMFAEWGLNWWWEWSGPCNVTRC